MKNLIWLAVSFLIASHSFASTTPQATKHEFTLAPKQYAQIWFDKAKRDSIKVAATERGNREIASRKKQAPAAPAPAANVTVKMSPELQAFETSFLQIKTSTQLDAALTKLNTEYDQYPNDLKFVAAQLIPMKAVRSLFYRMVPLFKKQRFTHSALLSFVKETSEGIHIFLPTEQWNAGFAYVSEPFTANDVQFQDEVDFQVYLAETVKQALEIEADRLIKISLAGTALFDNQLLYGSASFKDDIARYRIVNEADKSALLAGIYNGLSNIDVFCSYNVDQLLELGAELGRLYGIDGFKSFFTNDLTGAPSMERVQTLTKDNHYKNLFTKTQHGNEWMKEAFGNLQMAVSYSEAAWNEVKQRPMSEYWILDPRTIAPYGTDIQTAFDNLNAALEGKPIRSAVSGEVVTVSLQSFFNNSPDDLKVLVPTGFDDSADMITKAVPDADGNSTSVQYRNYLRGRPTAWNVAEYQKYFPDVKSNSDIEKTARVFSQSWGGQMGVGPLMTVMDF